VYRYGEQYPWYALHRTRDQRIFLSEEKILVPYRSKANIFGFFTDEVYSSRDVLFITQKNKNQISLKYILGLLNSKLYYLWLYHRGKRKGNTLELVGTPLSEIPIKFPTMSEKQTIIMLVEKVLGLTLTKDYLSNETKQNIVGILLAEIDKMVYEVYSLTDEEINLIETMTREE